MSQFLTGVNHADDSQVSRRSPLKRSPLERSCKQSSHFLSTCVLRVRPHPFYFRKAALNGIISRAILLRGALRGTTREPDKQVEREL